MNARADRQRAVFSGSDGIPLQRRDGITDEALEHFREAYPGETITKEDIFYYVYGILHSEDYRTRFADNLRKELPRIPRVKSAVDFWAFSKAGRALGELHVGYEKVAPYPVTVDVKKPDLPPKQLYRVEKMRYGKQKVGGKNVPDKSVLIYNEFITLREIPLDAYEYVVNGKPALDWVVERQRVKMDKASGIVNDANDWANETMGDPRYPLELFQRVITVSLETMRIVNGLPKLVIADGEIAVDQRVKTAPVPEPEIESAIELLRQVIDADPEPASEPLMDHLRYTYAALIVERGGHVDALDSMYQRGWGDACDYLSVSGPHIDEALERARRDMFGDDSTGGEAAE